MLTYLLSLALALGLIALPSGPALARSPAPPTPVTASTPVGDTVNINTADAGALTALAGVGPKLAEKIVEHRQANGPFNKPEDIQKVKGVGKAVWERNKSRIVVR